MSDVKEPLIEEVLSDSPIGREYIYRHPDATKDEYIKLSTDLNMIGASWNVYVKNNTTVVALSEPVMITTEKYGMLALTKVVSAGLSWEGNAATVMPWIPTEHLFLVEVKS